MMIIDDDTDTLDIITAVLKGAGYQVVAGKDITTLYAIEKEPPALLLINNWLSGGKTGHDVCYQLKQNPATAAIPVILISATVNLANTAQRCQANSYIIKPFDIDDLLSQVGKHLR
jgi:DNA-binding response OmpR family regulator